MQRIKDSLDSQILCIDTVYASVLLLTVMSSCSLIKTTNVCYVFLKLTKAQQTAL